MSEQGTEHVGVMIHTIDLEITNYLKHRLGKFQLAPEQHLVMALLLKQQGLTQNEIADQLRKDKSSMTRMLASLEKKGFIKREGCPNDRRCMKVYLTDEGESLRGYIDMITETTKEQFERDFSKEEKEELIRLLAKFRMNVQSADRKS
ncbi:MarR family winged helix-turn-helix transcriptional regulator [Paenibacillus paeoniae]|uniref:MarR family transcriptional regulator n=1 Tax=Paenibacillus paeoniae TaxID=2292705 RepID=A0A371PGJ6_9BACL|nr:MarR family transcriptional regulator [Paenibacillus paeoniae]REK74964.1 MarR family transcriptional regulator [Paenibacillus paeoniae]